MFSFTAEAQFLKKTFKFATFYTAFSGNNSVSDVDVYSVANGPLQVDVIETPFDYSLTAGVRKIARFSYENRANNFYSGNEQSYSDAATIGKVKGLSFCFRVVPKTARRAVPEPRPLPEIRSQQLDRQSRIFAGRLCRRQLLRGVAEEG